MNNTEKVNYYDFYSSAITVLETAAEVCKAPFPSVGSVDKALALLSSARVLLVSYNIEKANYESMLRSQKAAEQAKAAQQLEQGSSEVFGA